MEQVQRRPWRRWIVLVLLIVGFILGGIFVPVQPEIVVDGVEIVELPSTGAGTTAREVAQSEHTGWHYTSWCDSGWHLWYQYYAYAYNHNVHYNESFGNWGRCWF